MVVAPHNIATCTHNSGDSSSPADAGVATIDAALVGLDYILENPDYVEKLALALESDNVAVKKQVFELLSALCVYNTEGYARTFEYLDFHKTKCGERYRYKFLVRELEYAGHSSEYQTAILAFINCLILSTQDIRERIRIRSEFIGLKLLHVLHDLRNKEDADLIVQLDVFDEQKESDESQIDPNLNGIDLSSPLEVFDAILRQISDTPQEIPFLCILQHLLRIEGKEAISDIIWDAAERLVHRATLLESAEDARRLFKTQSHAKSLSKLKGSSTGEKCVCTCHQKLDRTDSTNTTNTPFERKDENLTTKESTAAPAPRTPVPPPPLPVPPQPATCPPPPPPLSNLNGTGNASLPKLPQQSIPTPSTKMRTVNWIKIPSGQVLQGSQDNLWATYAKTHSNTPISLDWGTLEGMFCLPNDKNNATLITRPKLVNTQQNEIKLSSKRESSEVILLDAKRSLNINIFLKQFRRSNDDMIKLIENGYSEDFGSEKLRGLLKIFPAKDEIEMLKSVSDEDRPKLANAEKFLLQLIQVENCKLRIEAMLLKEEFDPCINNVEGSINAILQAARDVKHSTELQEVIFMILVAGNFLNSGGYAGDAAGLKLSSLQKIADIRGNKPGISLLHFIAMQAEAKNPGLITFVDDLTTLDEASKTSTEQLKNEIRALKSKVTNTKEQLRQPNISQEILDQYNHFVQNATMQIEALETSFNDIERVRLEMATFFCEEVSNFKLEDCFKILATFINSWRMAANENNRRRVLEKEGEARRLLREAQVKKRPHHDEYAFKRKNPGSGSGDILGELISLSPRLTKRRIDVNGNTNSVQSSDTAWTPSPDTTPNGSLNRRRNRHAYFEDENKLMDFLRTSGGDFPRERGGRADSSGSLDRPWQRSSRRRLNLPEFNEDRERPTSPSTTTEVSSGSKTPSWFVDLDQDESEKRSQGNKRLSNDCGPGGLSTLREGDTSEEESSLAKAHSSGRRSSLKLHADVIGAMDAIEEAQGLVRDTPLWRRPSLTFASEESNAAKAENQERQSLIGSLASKPQHEKLILYIPHKSAGPTRSKSLYRQGSVSDVDQANVFGTEEGFNRYASIRRSQKVRQTPAHQLSKPSNHPLGSLGDQGSKSLNAKLSNDATANRLKTMFGSGKQKPDARPPLRRSASMESDHKPAPKAPPSTGRGKMGSPPTISERDEGFEESQSSLSESNCHMDASGVTRPNKIIPRRGGFREGREAVSTRSIVAAQKAAALKLDKQQVAATTAKVATPNAPEAKAMNNIGKSNSRASLLSSRNSLSSQNNATNKLPSTSAGSLIKPNKPPLTLRSVSATVSPLANRVRQNGVIRSTSKPEVDNSDKRHLAKDKSTNSKQQSSRILSFMRPTASSTAKDKVEPSTTSKRDTTSSRAKGAFK